MINLKTPLGKPLYITNAKLLDPSTKLNKVGEILLEDGKIFATGKPSELKAKAKSCKAEVLNADGATLVPGFIDLNTCVTEPGGEQKESFASVSRAAMAGGFTSLLCMPCTTPIHDNAFMTDFILRRARENALVRIFPIGAATVAKEGKKIAEIGSMVHAGVFAVCDDGSSIMDTYLMRKILEYSRAFSVPVFVHVEDKNLLGQAVMHEGLNSNRLGLRGVPSAAEEIMVARDIVLAKHTKGRIHFNSISVKGSLDQLRTAKNTGLNITAETNPHYFTLTSDSIATYDANYKCFPPLRTEEDMAAIIDALADGTLDCIATNHMPQYTSAKNVAFEHAAPGMIGLETAFALTYRLVLKKKITISRLVELLSCAPAKILGLEKEIGTLRKGARADLALLDLDKKYVYSDDMVQSSSRNTPFIGEKFQGAVIASVVNGTVIYDTRKAR